MSAFLKDDKAMKDIKACADFLTPADSLHFISRGPNVATAYQAALIFSEGAKCFTTGFTGGGFRHGPMELSTGEYRGVVFAPEGRTSGLTTAMAHEIAENGEQARVVLVTNGKGQSGTMEQPSGLRTVNLPSCEEHHFAFHAALFFELLLVHVAEKRGLTAGVFSVGSKITAKE
jgi:fructoselysine-6-P-deglycase FrlB-like protein